jgi:hypothetical protein
VEVQACLGKKQGHISKVATVKGLKTWLKLQSTSLASPELKPQYHREREKERERERERNV